MCFNTIRASTRDYTVFENFHHLLWSNMAKIWSNLHCTITKVSFDTQFAYVYENWHNNKRWNVEAKKACNCAPSAPKVCLRNIWMVPKPAIRSIFTDHFDHSLRNKSKAKKLQVFDKEDTNPARTISWLWARQLSLSILSTYLDKYLDLAKILQYQHFHKFV